MAVVVASEYLLLNIGGGREYIKGGDSLFWE